MLIAPGSVSFAIDAGARTSMIRTSVPAASCLLSSSAVFCLAPVAHFVSGSTGYLGCCCASANEAPNHKATRKIKDSLFIGPPSFRLRIALQHSTYLYVLRQVNTQN